MTWMGCDFCSVQLSAELTVLCRGQCTVVQKGAECVSVYIGAVPGVKYVVCASLLPLLSSPSVSCTPSLSICVLLSLPSLCLSSSSPVSLSQLLSLTISLTRQAYLSLLYIEILCLGWWQALSACGASRKGRSRICPRIHSVDAW